MAEPAWLDRGTYPFESRWWSTHEGRLHYVDEGQGDPLVFVHGVPTPRPAEYVALVGPG
jgi:hypothetical protein